MPPPSEFSETVRRDSLATPVQELEVIRLKKKSTCYARQIHGAEALPAVVAAKAGAAGGVCDAMAESVSDGGQWAAAPARRVMTKHRPLCPSSSSSRRWCARGRRARGGPGLAALRGR